ncbi:MAG TPA: hypothetical protein VLE99_03215 [Candidatus Saccharimonadales bacterium]|nr:hypothetical protein [Candidatus Saccharimonadales bacterium]
MLKDFGKTLLGNLHILAISLLIVALAIGAVQHVPGNLLHTNQSSQNGSAKTHLSLSTSPTDPSNAPSSTNDGSETTGVSEGSYSSQPNANQAGTTSSPVGTSPAYIPPCMDEDGSLCGICAGTDEQPSHTCPIQPIQPPITYPTPPQPPISGCGVCGGSVGGVTGFKAGYMCPMYCVQMM